MGVESNEKGMELLVSAGLVGYPPKISNSSMLLLLLVVVVVAAGFGLLVTVGVGEGTSGFFAPGLESLDAIFSKGFLVST